MEIRRIQPEEAELIVDLFDQYRIFYGQTTNRSLAREFLTERLDKAESVVYGAFTDVGGRLTPVGFTQLYPRYTSVGASKYWLLNDLYVDTAHRKQGIGGKLIRTALEFARAHLAHQVVLETHVNNHTAQSLYEQLGFERQDPDTEFYTYRFTLTH